MLTLAKRKAGDAPAQRWATMTGTTFKPANVSKTWTFFDGDWHEGNAPIMGARTHAAWGRVAQARGNLEAAREHYERAAAQFAASGLEGDLSATRALLATATRAV